MESELDIAEMKKVLEDADMYDPELPQQTMIDYYKAIKDSKDTATVEDETRRINNSQVENPNVLDESMEVIDNVISTPSKNAEKSFKPKVWSSIKKPTNNILEHNNNQNIKGENLEEFLNDSPKDATKVTFGFNEMVKDSEQTLSIISHELKFEPIQNTQLFLNSGIAVRAKMLYAYHTKMDKMKNQLARVSFYPAPVPKVINITDTFPIFPDVDFQETYVCRSGRQTKRKVYNYDDDDSQDGVSNKKTKNSEEQEWLCKTPQIKNTLRKKAESNNIVADMTESEIDPNIENCKQLQKPEPKTPLSKKATNIEIMKRSSLFVDSPKRRCEVMFDNLREEAKKTEKEDKVKELFYKTLPQTNEENSETVSSEEVITLCDDEPVKRRVVPTIPGRKPINNRKRTKTDGLTPLNVTVNQSTPKRDATVKNNSSLNSSQSTDEIVTKTNTKKRPGLRNSFSDNGSDSLPSTSQLSSTNIPCPICNCLFSEDAIEEHAATCGDEPVTRSTSKISRITCEVCDKVVEIDYDEHVKECKAIAKVRNL